MEAADTAPKVEQTDEDEEGITHAEKTVKDDQQVQKCFRPLVEDEDDQWDICSHYQSTSK